MTSLDILDRVISTLDDLGIDHVLVGAFSAIAYGLARATKDADFVVSCPPSGVAKVAEALGPDFALDRQVEFETLTNSKRNVVTHGPTGFAIEFFYLGDDPHHQERFRRRRRGMIGRLRRGVWLPSVEDVVIQKLRWRRDKDLADVRTVIAVSADVLDWDYVHRWTNLHGSTELLERIRREVEE